MSTKNTFIKLGKYFVTFFIFPALLLWAGFSHVGPLFQGEFTSHLASIEVSYIQMAQFVKYGTLWQPLWYLGYPMSLLYTPFVPYFELWANTLLGWSFGHGYRVLTAVAYVGGLVTFYFLVRELFKNSTAGVIAAAAYGILPSIVALIFSEVANDRFLQDLIEPRRFTILVRWGEGPHIVSLLFMPLAALFYLKFLRFSNKWALVWGAVFAGLTALTNSVGTWAMMLLFLAILVGEIGERWQFNKAIIMRATGFGVLSYGLIAFWFNLLFLREFFAEGGSTFSHWRALFPWGWLGVIAVVVLYIVVSQKFLSRARGAAATILFFLLTFGPVYVYYASGGDKIELVPQVLRLNTEADMAAAMLIGLFIATVGEILKKRGSIVFGLGMVMALVLLLPLGLRQLKLSQQLPQHTLALETKGVDLTSHPEHEVASQLERVVTTGERVLVPGNYAFYLNYFTRIPQLRGALFQSSIHPWPDHIYYQVTNGTSGEISLAWFKIANIGWVVYSVGRDTFNDYRYIGYQKFDETLELYQELGGGDFLYKVPLKNASLAKVVPRTITRISTPVNAIDEVPVYEYVDRLEYSEVPLHLKEIKNGEYEISGNVGKDELILMQMAYAPGWKAKDRSGKRLKVASDPFGFILITPAYAGEQRITLSYRHPWQVWLGRLVTGVTMVIVAAILLNVSKAQLDHANSLKENARILSQ